MSQGVVTKLAIIGTGRLGAALAARCAKAGYDVILGSRDGAKASRIAAELSEQFNIHCLGGASNIDAANQAALVILTVPHAAQRELLESLRPALKGKVVVTAVNALNPEDIRRVKLPAISAAVEAQELLGDEVKVVAAFQTVMHRILLDLDTPAESEAFVAGNDADAKRQVMRLAQAIGMRAWDIGPIENAAATETFASVILHLGAQHGTKFAGLRVTGIEG